MTLVHEGARRVGERAGEFAYRPSQAARGRLNGYVFILFEESSQTRDFSFLLFFSLSFPFISLSIHCMVLAATGPISL